MAASSALSDQSQTSSLEGLQLLRHLLGAETPEGFIREYERLIFSYPDSDTGDQGFGIEIDAGTLGRWSWGGHGLPLVDADLTHEKRFLGRLVIRGNEDSLVGQVLSRLGPLISPTVARLLAIQEAERRATADGLTGTLNRIGVEQRIIEELQRNRRSGNSMVLMMVDVDGLKLINDEHGHQAGDRALCRVADILVGATRGSDIVGRYGGDEFIIVLPETEQAAATLVARRVLRELAKDRDAPNVSIGLSESHESDSCDRLMGRADKAMYEVKSQGRDGVSAA